MKCINTIRLGFNTYDTCGGELKATVTTETYDYDCRHGIIVFVKCDKCGAVRHSNLPDIEEIFDLDKFLTDYIRSK